MLISNFNQVFQFDKPSLAQSIGGLFGLIGATLVATGYLFPGYVVFLVSSSAWIVDGLANRVFWLIAMNAGFTLVNVIGLLNYGGFLHG